MTPIEQALSRVSLRNTPFPVVLRTWNAEIPRLQVVLTVPDRETGNTLIVVHEHPVPPWHRLKFADEDEVIFAIDWIRLCLRLALEHEMLEWWHVDGKRALDPHRDDPRIP